MNKMVSSARLALEQIELRLNTITELGDVVVTLSDYVRDKGYTRRIILHGPRGRSLIWTDIGPARQS